MLKRTLAGHEPETREEETILLEYKLYTEGERGRMR